MNQIFLGRWWHWAIVAIAVLLMWQAGVHKMHVIHFNLFVISLIAGTFITVAVLVRNTRPGEQVTRDKIEDDDSSG